MAFSMLRLGAAGDFACFVGHVHDMHRAAPSQVPVLVGCENAVDGVAPGRQRDLSPAGEAQHTITDDTTLEQHQRRPRTAFKITA